MDLRDWLGNVIYIVVFPLQVTEGDVVEVDEVLEAAGEGGSTKFRRGRVVVEEIGARTKRGGYHLTLTRYKHYAIFHRNLWTVATHLEPFQIIRIRYRH